VKYQYFLKHNNAEFATPISLYINTTNSSTQNSLSLNREQTNAELGKVPQTNNDRREPSNK
jgi:hypothetical protein